MTKCRTSRSPGARAPCAETQQGPGPEPCARRPVTQPTPTAPHLPHLSTGSFCFLCCCVRSFTSTSLTKCTRAEIDQPSQCHISMRADAQSRQRGALYQDGRPLQLLAFAVQPHHREQAHMQDGALPTDGQRIEQSLSTARPMATSAFLHYSWQSQI